MCCSSSSGNWCFADLIRSMLITAFVILRSLFLPYAEPTVDESPVCSSLDVLDEVFKVMSALPLFEKRVLQKIVIQCVMSVILCEALETSRAQNMSSWCGPLCPWGCLEQAHSCRSGMGHPVAHVYWSAGRCALQIESVCVPFCAEVFLPLHWVAVKAACRCCPWRGTHAETVPVFSKVIHCLGD